MGCLGSFSILGAGGAGASLKLSCRGVACTAGGPGRGECWIELGSGGGLPARLGESLGVGVGG